MDIQKILFLKSDPEIVRNVQNNLFLLNKINERKFFAKTNPQEALNLLTSKPTLFVSGNWFWDMEYRLPRIAKEVRKKSPKSIIVGYTQLWSKEEIPELDLFLNTNDMPWKSSNDPLCGKLIARGIHPCIYPILRILALPFEDMTRRDVISFLSATPNWEKEITAL